MSFTNLLPETSVRRLIDVVLKDVKPDVRAKIRRRYALATKSLRSGDTNVQRKGYELMITLIRDLHLKEIELETTVTQLNATDITAILEFVGRLALGVLPIGSS